MKKRPLSPHLQIYQWQFTMLTSIIHRISGVILSGALLLIIAGFVLLAHGAQFYEFLRYYGASNGGKLVLLLLVLSFSYHFMNGIRHLIWDIGHGFALNHAKISAQLVGLGTIALTIIIFLVGYGVLS